MILLSSNFNVLRWIGAHTLYQALHLHHRFRFHPLVEAEAHGTKTARTTKTCSKPFSSSGRGCCSDVYKHIARAIIGKYM